MNPNDGYVVTFHDGPLKKPILDLWATSSLEGTEDNLYQNEICDCVSASNREFGSTRERSDDTWTHTKDDKSSSPLVIREIIIADDGTPKDIPIIDLLDRRDKWLSLLIDQKKRIIVGFLDGRFEIDSRGNHFAYVSTIFVRADLRRRGLGTFLATATLYELLKRIPYILLENKTNPTIAGTKLFFRAAKESRASLYNESVRVESDQLCTNDSMLWITKDHTSLPFC